jgi:hypothetical protein
MMDHMNQRDRSKRAIYTLAMVNVGNWAIAMIAMIFLIQQFPGAKSLFPILGGGSAVGVALIASIAKLD